jgi:ubiquinone/menaquinone biosynthesis C-methylase UbiE
MLDLGCGTGQAILRFGLSAARADRIIGVDHSKSMLSVARRKIEAAGGDRTELICSDVLEWLRTSEMAPFDLVTAIGFLHHLSDEQVDEALSWIAFRTRSTGRVIIAEPMVDPAHREPRAVKVWNRFSLARRRGYSVRADEPDERPLQRELLDQAVERAGLQVRAHTSSWEIFNWSLQPGWIQRRAIALLYRWGGPGIVNAWCLQPTPALDKAP